MAAVVSYSVLPSPSTTLYSKTLASFVQFERTYQFEQNRLEMVNTGMCVKRKALNRLMVMSSSSKNYSAILGPDSASDTIKHFYKCINEKNLKQLSDYISQDCLVEDCSFPQPFQGRKEVLGFFQQLSLSMGRNVMFSLSYVCEGDDLTAGATWHLEWKKAKIPFTRGCTFFECSRYGDRIFIEKALVMIESPIKPGGLALALFKIVTSLFDDFPKAAEWFLSSPHAILQWIIRIYAMFLAPLLSPIMESYMKLASYIVRLLGYVFNIIIYMMKIFFK